MDNAFAAFIIIGILILAGKFIRRRLAFLRRLFLPSSIIAGLLALLLGPQGIGRISGINGMWTEAILEVWSKLPGILISVVFAALFLGKSLPGIKKIWSKAGPMVAHGQTMAWGQYVVGISLAMFVLVPVWDSSPLAGALIEIGFEGGHGTAAGLGNTFRELGFADGADMALGLATIGVIMGVLLGTMAINWAVWKQYIAPPGRSPQDEEAMAEHETREKNEADDLRDKAIEPLSFHWGLVGSSIGLGWLLLKGLIWLENALLTPLGWPELFRHVPLFPLAMIGGVAVQSLGDRLGYAKLIDRQLMNRISGSSLDILIVAAMGALSLDAIGANTGPFLLLATGGILWNIFGFAILARLMFPRDWVPNGLANFGQGMGMTVIGLLLIRMSDPQNRSGAMEAFGYKQLLFEPIVGGGLFTAISLPLIYQFGPGPVLAGVSALMTAWLIGGLWLVRRRKSS